MKGIAVSPGLAVAPPLLLAAQSGVRHRDISQAEAETEIRRFRCAAAGLGQQMRQALENARQELSKDEKDILNMHISLLQDQAMIEDTVSIIAKEHIAAECALDQNVKSILDELESLNDACLRERAVDIRDVYGKLLGKLTKAERLDLSALQEDVIVVAHELEPSEFIAADKSRLKGIACEQGGPTSHTAILARNYGIPAVFGLAGLMAACRRATLIAVDGSAGTVTIDPDEGARQALEAAIEKRAVLHQELAGMIHCEGETIDGKKVAVYTNIASAGEAERAVAQGAQGVGLFRTEFVFMDRNQPPSEEEQYAIYRQAAEVLKGRPIIIRTLDAGGDKRIGYLNTVREGNPFLGSRAIRLCLRNPMLFKTQLRALLRAGAYGNVRIMYPMISSLEELAQASALLDECKHELAAEGRPFAVDVPVGIMVEIPSAAISADLYAGHVDFFSIGTNDLIQYTLAVDRANPEIQPLYDAYNPSVLRLIDNTVCCARRAGIEVGICGEMGSNLLLVPIFAAMGVTELSVNLASIGKIKYLLSRIDAKAARPALDELLQMERGTQIRAYLEAQSRSWGTDFLL
ncbi:MAG: phosphoenolpyruvate--protein phosphotransferase [Candidatus Pelethousia sp.]|nr:phosphoenolpyruvate--protein phosphotransferase [Candidatus Pelethousia sp.]